MNIIHLPASLVETLGWVLVHSVWQLALIAVVAMLLARGMGHCSARTRYAMLVVALAAMTAAPIATLFVLPKPEPVVVVADEIAMTAAPAVVSWSAADVGPAYFNTAAAPDQALAETKRSSLWDSLASVWSSIERAVRSWSPTIVGLWCLGVCLLAWRPALSWREVGRLRRVGVSPAPDGIRAALNILAWRMRVSQTVQILESTRVRVPVVIGYLRPMILLPVSLVSQLPVPQLEAILAHELAHIRRHDYLVNLWQILVETVLFYHPAVWWLSHRIRVERENCCDDIAVAVVEDRVEYSRALLAVAELQGPQTTLALGARGGSLLARVRRLFPAAPGQRTLDSGSLVAFGLLAMSIVALVLWAAAVAKEPDAGAVAKDQAQAADRVLHFPADRIMGIVYVRELYEKGYAHGVAVKEWKKIGEARGDVRVPAGPEVRLDLNKAASGDLSGLDQLAPDDLTVLSCRDTDVTDEGLPHIGRLSGLLILELDQTRIDAGFRHLAGLTKLRFVDLGAFNVHREGFGVGDESLQVLAGFPKLETIRLRDTKVTGAGLAALAPLESLANLDLSGTRVGDAGLAFLKQLPALKLLQLGVSGEGADITDEGLKTVGEMVNLTYLALSGNKISDEGLIHLKNLSRLEDLSLDKTGITEAGLANLEPLQAIQNLRLYTGHQIKDVGAAHLAKLKSLRRLTDNLILTDAGVASLASLPHLEHLSLSDSKITIDGAKSIAGMKSLTWLHFHHCPIDDEKLAAMCDLPNLDFLQLSNTEVSGDGLKHLVRLPKLSAMILGFGDRDEQPAGLKPHLREVARLSHLKDLRLRGWGLDSSDLKEISGMLNLEALNLNMPVDDEGAEHISGLRNLQSLEIHGGVLTDAGLKNFSNLGQLTYLTLSGHFTDRGLASLAPLQSLWGLQVSSPYITDAGLRELEQQLPALQFCSSWKDPNDQAKAENPVAPATDPDNMTRGVLQMLKRLGAEVVIHHEPWPAATTQEERAIRYEVRFGDSWKGPNDDWKFLEAIDHPENLSLYIATDQLSGLAQVELSRPLARLTLQLQSDASLAQLDRLPASRSVVVHEGMLTLDGYRKLFSLIPETENLYLGGMAHIDDGRAKNDDVFIELSSRLTHLVSLRTGGLISSIGLQAISKLADLKELQIGMFATEPADVAALAGFKHLEKLGITCSQGWRSPFPPADVSVGDAVARIAEGMPTLRQLYIGVGTPISQQGMEAIAALEKLQSLRVELHQVEDQNIATASRLTRLRYLWMGGEGKLTDAGLAPLKNLSVLNGLTLPGQGLTDAALAHLAPLTALKKFGLRGGQFTGSGLIALQPLQQLTRIDLAHSNFNDDGCRLLPNVLPGLVTLDLRGTKATDAGLAELAQLKNLAWLNVHETTVTAQGVGRLRTALPKIFLVNDVSPQPGTYTWPGARFETVDDDEAAADNGPAIYRSADAAAAPATVEFYIGESEASPGLKEARVEGNHQPDREFAVDPELAELDKKIAAMRQAIKEREPLMADPQHFSFSALRRQLSQMEEQIAERKAEIRGQLGASDELIYLHQKPVLTRADIAQVRVVNENNQPAIDIVFTEAGKAKIGKATEENLGKRIAVVVDGKVIFAAVIRSKIDDRARISFSRTDVEKLAQAIGPISHEPAAEQSGDKDNVDDRVKIEIYTAELGPGPGLREVKFERNQIEKRTYLREKPLLTQDDIAEVHAIGDDKNPWAIDIVFADAGNAKAKAIGNKPVVAVINNAVTIALKVPNLGADTDTIGLRFIKVDLVKLAEAVFPDYHRPKNDGKTDVANAAAADSRLPKADVEKLAQAIHTATRKSQIEAGAAKQAAADRDRLKAIGLALQVYHGAHKRFPRVDIQNKYERPGLSWRIAILPYLNGGPELYKQFHLDEPWDSEHNRKLIDQMPDVFRSSQVGQGRTRLLAAVDEYESTVAPGTPWAAFRPDTEGASMTDFTDGTSLTIMVVEADADHAVVWTKPEELVVDRENPKRGITDGETDFWALFADGSVHDLKGSIRPELLRALFTRDGGERIDHDELLRNDLAGGSAPAPGK